MMAGSAIGIFLIPVTFHVIGRISAKRTEKSAALPLSEAPSQPTVES
jgi:hypothetical protein